MRNFYLVLGVAFTSIAFIFAVENMWLRSPAMFIFFKGTYIIGILLLVMMLLSIVGGFFLGLFLSSNKEDEESSDDIFE